MSLPILSWRALESFQAVIHSYQHRAASSVPVPALHATQPSPTDSGTDLTSNFHESQELDNQDSSVYLAVISMNHRTRVVLLGTACLQKDPTNKQPKFVSVYWFTQWCFVSVQSIWNKMVLNDELGRMSVPILSYSPSNCLEELRKTKNIFSQWFSDQYWNTGHPTYKSGVWTAMWWLSVNTNLEYQFIYMEIN